jgi:hypothetical protein
MTKLRAGFLGNSGSILGRKWPFSYPKLLERLWFSTSLLHGEYKSLFPWGKGGHAVKLSTTLYVLSSVRMGEPILPLLNSLTDSGKV